MDRFVFSANIKRAHKESCHEETIRRHNNDAYDDPLFRHSCICDQSRTISRASISIHSSRICSSCIEIVRVVDYERNEVQWI